MCVYSEKYLGHGLMSSVVNIEHGQVYLCEQLLGCDIKYIVFIPLELVIRHLFWTLQFFCSNIVDHLRPEMGTIQWYPMWKCCKDSKHWGIKLFLFRMHS